MKIATWDTVEIYSNDPMLDMKSTFSEEPQRIQRLLQDISDIGDVSPSHLLILGLNRTVDSRVQATLMN